MSDQPASSMPVGDTAISPQAPVADVSIHIDELHLDGVPPEQGAQIRAAFQSHLETLLARETTFAKDGRNAAARSADGGAIEVDNLPPSQVGRQVAERVFAQLRPHTERGGRP